MMAVPVAINGSSRLVELAQRVLVPVTAGR